MSALTVLKYKSYRNYTVGRFVLMSGQWLHRMAVGWLVWNITGSTVWLGAFAIVEAVVALFLTPIAGVVADRFDPIKVLKISQSVYFLFALMLAFLVVNDLITLTLLMPIFIVMAAVPAISQPIGMAIVSRLVPHGDELAKAVGLNAVVLHASRFVGPAIGGVIVAKLGMAFLFSVALMPPLFLYCHPIFCHVGLRWPSEKVISRASGPNLRGRSVRDCASSDRFSPRSRIV